MKILNQIIFIIIVIGIIFMIKDDYKSIYSKSLSYIQNEMNTYAGLGLKDKIGEIINSAKGISSGDSSNDILSSKNAESLPGALVVSDSFLTNRTKEISLSSQNIIDITNKYRKENGDLPPLTNNSKLFFSAEKKLQDMFMKGYFEHISPEGVGVGDLGNDVGYEYILIGENLALGNFKNDQALVDAWMASPGHKANILNKRYTEIGVSVGKGTYKGETVWMAVQHFGLPKSSCPVVDSVLKRIIDIDQQKIKDMEGDIVSKKAKIDSGVVSEGVTINDQISTYNSLVKDYNKIILEIKEKINSYNAQVRDFNTCISNAS